MTDAAAEPPGRSPARGPVPSAAPSSMAERRRRTRRLVVRRSLLLAVTAVSLYLVAPSLVEVISSWPQVVRLEPWWLAAMLAAETTSFVCMWWLLRIALSTRRWLPVATAQLASNAVSRIVPGGAAAGAAVQYRMLATAGIDRGAVVSAITATSLIGLGTVLSLPLLALPAMLGGTPVDRGLAEAAFVGAGLFVLLGLAGAALLAFDAPLRVVGTWAQRLHDRLLRHRSPLTGLSGRLIEERDLVRGALGRRWWHALAASAGNWGFDYLALLAALTAVGARPNPSLVLLAFVAAVVLGMIPITPGGLGFVEAGLTATLTLAGVPAGDAVVATLAYRLVSYWLPLPIGLAAYWLHRRTHR